jgi:hypothetical protein
VLTLGVLTSGVLTYTGLAFLKRNSNKKASRFCWLFCNPKCNCVAFGRANYTCIIAPMSRVFENIF